MTQEALALKVDLSPGYISKLEREDRHPPAHTAELLADYFQLEGEERAAFLEAARRLRVEHRKGLKAPARLLARIPAPPPGTRFLTGRDKEIQDLFDRLSEPGVVINVAGEPAIGKTTVALEVAHRYRDQKRVVLWGDAREGTAERVAQVEALIWNSIFEGSMTGGEEQKQERLSAALAEYEPLIVLDNLESAKEFDGILDFARQISEDASVLITSRRRIPPRLGDNVSLVELSEHEGIQLFKKIGRDHDRQPVTEEDHLAIEIICTDFLEGHPGAIEIAASLWQGWPLEAILSGLKQRALDTLKDQFRPETDINRSMRISIELSYDLLHKENLEVWELFPRLSVFRASFYYKAVEAVTGLSAVLHPLRFLLARSLVRFDGRRHSLHSVVREFGLEKLGEERGEYELRAAQYFLAFAREHETDFDRLNEEKGNFFATMDWAEAHQEHRSIAVELADLLFSFMDRRGMWVERRRRVHRALQIAELIGENKEEIVILCYRLGEAYLKEEDYKRAQECVEKGLTLAQQLGQPGLIQAGLSLFAALALSAGERYPELTIQARRLIEQAEVWDDDMLRIYSYLGEEGPEKPDEAYFASEEGPALAYQSEDARLITAGLEELFRADIRAQDFSSAEERVREYESLARLADDPLFEGTALLLRGTLLWYTSRPEGARGYLMDAVSHFEQAGMFMEAVKAREGLVLAAIQLKDLPLAEEQLKAMASTHSELGNTEMAAAAFFRLMVVQQALNKKEEARISHEKGLSLCLSPDMFADPRKKEMPARMQEILFQWVQMIREAMNDSES